MKAVTSRDAGRQAHGRQSWQAAFDHFTEADAAERLGADDLALAAEAANMLGRGEEEAALLRRAYHAYAEAGMIGPALRCAFWLCKGLGFGGEFAQAGAWLSRARRLAEAHPGHDGFAYGYVSMLDAEALFRSSRYEEMLPIASRLAETAAQGADRDLQAGAAMTLGNALIKNGRIEEGLARLDEAMVAVVGGELSARCTGMIYCVVIGTCQELQELHRTREWSDALAGWCAAQPDFTGAYRGLCRVHRVAVLQQAGDWPSAVREARLACRQLTGGLGEVVAGGAFYQLAEVHRLRGEFGEAEQAFREAVRYGLDPQPGMALMWLAQGRKEPAVAAVRRALAEVGDGLRRARLLPAAVEILLASGDVAAAGAAAAELHDLAGEYGTTAMEAMAAHATGAVRLAESRAEAAVTSLRRACRLWRELEMPYETARTQVLVALACGELGDAGTAAMELDTAREVFARLGAAPDVARVDALLRGRRDDRSGLSPRELEVVRLLAAGRTNRAIAATLSLSEKTVARHVSNVFGKLGVDSRTAVAAYAFEHGLV